MGKIKIFKGNRVLAKFFVILGIIFTILATAILIKSVIDGFNTKFPSGNWSPVLFTIQGILFIFMGYSYLKSGKYYIEWDDNELHFLLPDVKSVETI